MRNRLNNVKVFSSKSGILYRQVTVTEENELELHDVVEEVFIFIIVSIIIFIILIIMICIIVIIIICIIVIMRFVRSGRRQIHV